VVHTNLERYNLLKRFHDWLFKPIEIHVFDWHNELVEIKDCVGQELKVDILEESKKPRKICQRGRHSLGVTLQKNWLTSICNGKPEGRLVNVKWIRHHDTKKCAILIEGANDAKEQAA
jgi:hypothetical protein